MVSYYQRDRTIFSNYHNYRNVTFSGGEDWRIEWNSRLSYFVVETNAKKRTLTTGGASVSKKALLLQSNAVLPVWRANETNRHHGIACLFRPQRHELSHIATTRGLQDSPQILGCGIGIFELLKIRLQTVLKWLRKALDTSIR